MTSAFNFNRFAKLLKTEILIKQKSYMILSLIMIFIISFGYYLISFDTIDAGEITIYTEVFFNFAMAIAFLAPLIFYLHLYDRQKDVPRAMLPASQLEKIISAIIQVGFIVPILLFLISVILTAIISYIHLDSVDINYTKYLRNNFYNLQAQSFLFFAVFFFKNNKIFKIIITGISIMVFMFIFIGLSTTIFKPFWEDLFIIFSNHFELDDINNLYALGTIIKIMFYILVPLGPWFLSYRRLTKTQI